MAEGLRAIDDLESIEDTGDLTLAGGKGAAGESCRRSDGDCDLGDPRLLLARLAAAGLPVPERLISGDMVERGKPDPEPYRRGAELLGLDAGECVVVEDAPSGVARAWRRLPRAGSAGHASSASFRSDMGGAVAGKIPVRGGDG